MGNWEWNNGMGNMEWETWNGIMNEQWNGNGTMSVNNGLGME